MCRQNLLVTKGTKRHIERKGSDRSLSNYQVKPQSFVSSEKLILDRAPVCVPEGVLFLAPGPMFKRNNLCVV